MGTNRFNLRTVRDFTIDFINKNYSSIKKRTYFKRINRIDERV